MVYISLVLGYSFYYFYRKSYTFAIPALIRNLYLKKNELGVITSGFAAVGATSEYPATDTPSLNLQVRGWINIKLSASVVRSVLLKCYRGPQSRSGWISYGVSV